MLWILRVIREQAFGLLVSDRSNEKTERMMDENA